MAKVFTITEGLENLGALKTGGQGSVYKGRRIGEIFSAIKILPTPIHSETADDKNFIAFQNEVQKLKKVNETPDPNVVKILNFGITDSGNFPFIEMEFIEGPDLAELLMPPGSPVFSIKEILKVAEQLSHALAHCHKLDVKHGDIKSNNIKFNRQTGNYVLLDFGLAVMSDEQRRTSLRHAGAIEFMAPEQNEGRMLFETDVYSFGVILFELLAGTVPFPLADKGETARNLVMISHMETPPPNPLILRNQSLPEIWSEEKREQEMYVPNYLLSMIDTCLQKKPSDRFANGVELHEYFIANSIIADNNESGTVTITSLRKENKMLHERIASLEEQLKEHLSGPILPLGITPGREKRSIMAWTKSGILWAALAVLAVIFLIVALATNDNNAVPEQVQTDSRNDATRRSNIATDSSTVLAENIIAELNEARTYLNDDELPKALSIYDRLSKQGIPEAMFEYGNLALLGSNTLADCKGAFGLILKAADKGYTPAKRTAGFLYAFADDASALEQNNYTRCTFSRNVPEGSKLLMEAMLEGDTTASKLLDTLNLKNNPGISPHAAIQ